MNKLNLIWIIPLCITLGFSIGLYYSIPQNYTIDYGENTKYIIEEMKEMDLSVNNTNCPDCICPDVYFNEFECFKGLEQFSDRDKLKNKQEYPIDVTKLP